MLYFYNVFWKAVRTQNITQAFIYFLFCCERHIVVVEKYRVPTQVKDSVKHLFIVARLEKKFSPSAFIDHVAEARASFYTRAMNELEKKMIYFVEFLWNRI
jgi:hypothetical protein